MARLPTSRPQSRTWTSKPSARRHARHGNTAYIERVIGSFRRECLDHVIVLNEAGLRSVLTAYMAYYMRSRTHLGLAKDTPVTRPVQSPSAGRVVATAEVGGLHHR